MSEENKYTAAIPLPPESGGQFSSGMELLSKVLKGAFLLMAGVIIAMLAWFLSFGGSFIVDSTTESVLVLKFGKLQKQYDQGWHWFLPYPVNKIVRIPIIKQELRTIAFMPYNTEKLKNPAAKQNEGPNANTLAPGIDGYALLGDNAIMHSEWKLTYRVSEPVKYFQNCMSREKTFASMDNASGPDQETVKLDNASMMLKNLLDDA